MIDLYDAKPKDDRRSQALAHAVATEGMQMPEDDDADMRRFHNRLRILRSIDGDKRFGPDFTLNPFHAFIVADDLQQRAIWDALRRREGA